MYTYPAFVVIAHFWNLIYCWQILYNLHYTVSVCETLAPPPGLHLERSSSLGAGYRVFTCQTRDLVTCRISPKRPREKLGVLWNKLNLILHDVNFFLVSFKTGTVGVDVTVRQWKCKIGTANMPTFLSQFNPKTTVNF